MESTLKYCGATVRYEIASFRIRLACSFAERIVSGWR